MLSFVLVLFFLSSVLAFRTIRFSSIQQCGPFNVTFSGTQPAALPLTLTVVPFGSSAVPLSIPLPNTEWDSETSTGVAITFLPYPAGTTFIASLDDSQGRSTGHTSDIMRIQQSGDTSCISSAEQSQTYTPGPPFSQCQPFDVTFDPIRAFPPIVRLFVPNGQAFSLDQIQEPTDPGTSNFTMVAFRGQPVVLLFRDESARLQSTNLITVTGDATSSKSCFPDPPAKQGPNRPKQAGLSKQAVTGIVASIVSVVTLLSILVVLHLFLRYRRSSRARGEILQGGIERGPGFAKPGVAPPPDTQPAQSSWNAITIINKSMPYPMEKYTSRPVSPYFVQSTPQNHDPDRYEQMQSLSAATADLDQILNASVIISDGGEGIWSSSLSPSTPHSQDIQYTELPSRTKEQHGATILVSPSSSPSNLEI